MLNSDLFSLTLITFFILIAQKTYVITTECIVTTNAQHNTIKMKVKHSVQTANKIVYRQSHNNIIYA